MDICKRCSGVLKQSTFLVGRVIRGDSVTLWYTLAEKMHDGASLVQKDMKTLLGKFTAVGEIRK